MKNIILLFCLLLMTISCNQSKNQSHIELKKSMRTNSIEEREGTTVTKHDRVKDACRILNDMSSLVEYMLYGMNNDLIEQLITGLEGDPSFNYFDFLINELGVEQSLVNSIMAYEPGELQMIEYEIEYPASNGLIYSLYLNSECSGNPLTDDTLVETPCGGWRPILLVLSTTGCFLGSPIACVGAVISWGTFASDGCLS